jgi:hypothetical protein
MEGAEPMFCAGSIGAFREIPKHTHCMWISYHLRVLFAQQIWGRRIEQATVTFDNFFSYLFLVGGSFIK